LELKNLMELVDEYRSKDDTADLDLRKAIYSTAVRAGMLKDVPLTINFSEKEKETDRTHGLAQYPDDVNEESFSAWVTRLSDYLNVIQDRLFSKGLHVLGGKPSQEDLRSYLEAYFGDKLTNDAITAVLSKTHQTRMKPEPSLIDQVVAFFRSIGSNNEPESGLKEVELDCEAMEIASLLDQSTEELDSVVRGLNGGYVLPAPGGDLLRDGKSVLPTGRNIHALDPYRMPSPSAWRRGQRAAAEILRQHQAANNGGYPETVAVTLWGLDSIKTRGESIAIVLSLAGAEPVKEGTGRIVRYDLVPLAKLGRPRIDVLASLSGIFRYVAIQCPHN
jgi:magnesium chelatase subunit H